MNIQTSYQSTPALWAAYDADTYDGAPDSKAQPVGYGKTEREAINNLVEQLMDDAADDGYRAGWQAAKAEDHAPEAAA